MEISGTLFAMGRNPVGVCAGRDTRTLGPRWRPFIAGLCTHTPVTQPGPAQSGYGAWSPVPLVTCPPSCHRASLLPPPLSTTCAQPASEGPALVSKPPYLNQSPFPLPLRPLWFASE